MEARTIQKFKYTSFTTVTYYTGSLLWRYSESTGEATANSTWKDGECHSIKDELFIRRLSIGDNGQDPSKCGVRISEDGKDFIIDNFMHFVWSNGLHITDIQLPKKPLEKKKRAHSKSELAKPRFISERRLGLFHIHKKPGNVLSTDYPLISPRNRRSFQGILFEDLACRNQEIAKLIHYQVAYSEKQNELTIQLTSDLIITKSDLIKRKKTELNLEILRLKKEKLKLVKKMLQLLQPIFLSHADVLNDEQKEMIISHFEGACLDVFKEGNLGQFLDFEQFPPNIEEESLIKEDQELIDASKTMEKKRIERLIHGFEYTNLPVVLVVNINVKAHMNVEEYLGLFILLSQNLKEMGVVLRENKQKLAAYKHDSVNQDIDYMLLSSIVSDVIPHNKQDYKSKHHEPIKITALLQKKIIKAICCLNKVDKTHEPIYIQRHHARMLIEKLKIEISPGYDKKRGLGRYIDRIDENKWMALLNEWLSECSDAYKERKERELNEDSDNKGSEEKKSGSWIRAMGFPPRSKSH